MICGTVAGIFKRVERSDFTSNSFLFEVCSKNKDYGFAHIGRCLQLVYFYKFYYFMGVFTTFRNVFLWLSSESE